MASGGLTIKDVNDLLDRLASAENRTEKISVLSTLINKTNAQEMKWIIMIILKDLKLGVSEKSIFHEFHPDAEDLFNVTCDLKLVCEKLRDRNLRHKRQDIEVGKAVRPQLAMRVADATSAWKKLHGKEVVVECKFDGDRIQIHKNGTEIHFFSRSFLDHSEYGHGMSDIILQNVLVDRCILDGEMLVWDTSLNCFAEFGSNQEIAKAAKNGLDSDRQLCYVAFDVLYVGDTSVIHQSLNERHQLLQKVVRPLKGRLEILVPNAGLGLNGLCPSGEPCWSLVAHKVDDIERFFKETIENREEGIVLKDLGSKWEPGDRSGKWLKLKPDYIRAGSDLDVLIIGGYYGSGRRGGEVAQFLVGLAERPAPNTYPRRFISFCRVGTGLSDEELDAVATKLKPYLRKYEYPRKPPPSFYQVTNNSKERPDVWIESPEKSIILSITSDIRTIRSEVFAAPYSLRFPRIDRVRYDKPWHECLDVQSFVELVHSSNGTTQRGADSGGLQGTKPKRMELSRKGEGKNISVVPSHLIQTDISNIKEGSSIFANMMFYFVNVPPRLSLDSLHKMIAENGGTFSMNLNNSVTHCVAADSKGIKYQAAKLRGDIIHYSWVLDCCLQKKLIHLQSKYFLFLSDSSKKKLQEEIDEFSDPYYQELDLAGIKQLLSNVDRPEHTKTIDYYKKKYCPKKKWSLLCGCRVYFHSSIPSLKPDWELLLGLALRRLKLETSMAGGKVSSSLALATHLVVLSVPGFDVDFETLLTSFTSSEKHLLWTKGLQVVKSQWLEECLERGQRLQEGPYSLKTFEAQESKAVECKHDKHDPGKGALSGLDNEEKQNMSSALDLRKQKTEKPALEKPKILTSCEGIGKRKGGRPAGTSTKKGKTAMAQARRSRAHIGKGAAKISYNESDESTSHDEKTDREEIKIEGNYEMAGKGSSEIQGDEIIKDYESSPIGKAAEQQVEKDVRCEDSQDKAPEVEVAEMHDSEDSERPKKLEVMIDPIQAMLLDMIPSLGGKETGSRETILKDEKPPLEPIAEPSKKRKVSYKDVAGELLKDW